jgi:WD40 repeat protein
MANVALSFDAWKPGVVRPATVEVPVEVIEAVESPQLLATLKGHEEIVWRVAWAPDGKTLASLVIQGEVKLWDVAARKERTTLRSDLGNGYSLAFTPDGKTLLVGHHQHDPKAGPTGGIALWDVMTGQRKGLLQHTSPRGVSQFALAPNGRMIAALESWKEGEKGAYQHGVTYWRGAGGQSNAFLADAFLADETASALAFSPDGNVLARSAYLIKDNQITAALVRRRDLTEDQELPELSNPAGKSPLNSLAFSPDGRTLAGADFRGNIILWDTASGKVRTTMEQQDQRRATCLAFAPDGRTLVAAVGDRPGRDREPGLIVLYDAATSQRRLTLTGHTNAVMSVAFSPDGRLLASSSSDRTVRLWDMTTLPPAPSATSGRR